MKKIITLLLMTGCLFGQFNEFEFESFTTANGLSNNWGINAFAQDKYGYLWIATIDGLNRFDGYEFKIYQHNPADSSSLKSNEVSSIFIDNKSRLWVSSVVSGGCLSLYNQQTDNFFHHRFVDSAGVKLPMGRVINLYEGKDGISWLVKSNGYYSYEVNKWLYNPEKSKSLQSIFSGYHISWLFEDSKGSLWAAVGSDGLVRYNPESAAIKTYRHIEGVPSSLKSNSAISIFEDAGGEIFIGTDSDGLHRYDPYLDTIIRLPEASGKYWNLSAPLSKGPIYGSNKSVTIIRRTNDGNFWVGTINGGIKVYNNDFSEFKLYSHNSADKFGLGGDFIISFYTDQQNNNWIGTFNQGFMKVVPSRSMFSLKGNGLSSLDKLNINLVRGVFESRDKKLWIGTGDGRLVIYNPQTKKTKTYKFNDDNTVTKKGPSGSDIQSFYEDEDGQIWIASFNGIDTYNPNTGIFSRLKIETDGKTNNLQMDIEGIIPDDDSEHIWIATWSNGLLKYHKKSLSAKHFRYTPESNTLAGNNIWTLNKTNDGHICVGTENGLSVYNKLTGSFQNYLAGKSINTIFEDDDHILWLGSNQGLYSLDLQRNHIKHYTTKDGLPNNMIGGILAYDNFLWIGTGNGLVRFNPDDKTFLTYDESDGIQMNLYETGNSYFKTSDGLLLFGSFGGITVVDPAKIAYNRTPPKTLITELQIFDTINDTIITRYNRKHEPKNTITLEYTQNDITFNYVGIHLKKPQRNIYKYKLEPYEQKWQEAGNLRTTRYTSLTPGRYTFKVIAANSDGIWNEEPVTIGINILPPWWKTWWAYTIYVLIIFLLLYSLRRFELNRRKEKENKRFLELENKRKSDELDEARQLQLSMLPKELPQLPHLDIAVYMQTATEVGGDYYDFHVGMDGTLTVVIGDATGHGMKAGTMVTTAKSLFRSYASNPDILFSFQEFTRCIKEMNFGRTSMCLSMLKISGNKLQMSTAGIPPTYIYRQASNKVEEHLFKGMPLGAMEKFPYELKDTTLKQGDTILLLSDGLPELENKDGTMFGYKKISDGFEEIAEKSPDDIISYLKNEAASWSNNADPDDDVTFVAIKVK